MTEPERQEDVSDILRNLQVCSTLVRETEQLTPVWLQMSGFQLTANWNLGGERISDVLNRPLSEYIQCHDVKIYRGEEQLDEVAKVKIRKSEIIVAGLFGEEQDAAKRRLGNRRKLNQFETLLMVDHWIVRGRLHLESDSTSNAFITANREFLPVQDASIQNTELPGYFIDVNVAIVNRARISMIEIVGKPQPQQP